MTKLARSALSTHPVFDLRLPSAECLRSDAFGWRTMPLCGPSASVRWSRCAMTTTPTPMTSIWPRAPLSIAGHHHPLSLSKRCCGCPRNGFRHADSYRRCARRTSYSCPTLATWASSLSVRSHCPTASFCCPSAPTFASERSDRQRSWALVSGRRLGSLRCATASRFCHDTRTYFRESATRCSG